MKKENNIKKYSWLIRLIVLGLIILSFVVIKPLRDWITGMTRIFSSMDSVREYILSFGAKAVVVSFLLMILQAIVAPIPAFVITFSNAMIWGWWRGAILSWSSAMAGAAICFFISRIFGREAAEKLAGRSTINTIENYFEEYGGRTIMIARLLPFVPFDPVSYIAGLTPMGFWEFFIATGIGQTPATIVYSYAAANMTQPSTFVRGLFILFGVTGVVWLTRTVYTDKQEKKKQEKEND